ncbi:transcription elongation factor GreAB [Hanamia caeni]|jgi:regulator of nucleoside diphosphate kinase|uniref:Transcription elongation factor GreAB n=1 Tax=Hanamia caeni TaxID=2294116 RepID=A0A3M9NLB1_9BACT|nr:GreA/GreB family elongation factor [Hanamia caeni]RNI37983.1 transcription elongation factor GreAB [Hanamia caeni]
MATATLNPATTPVIITRTDFEILNSYVKNLHGMQVNERENFSKLSGELKKAQIVEDDSMSADIVRLGSTVVIKDLVTRRDMTVTIVLPSKADIKQKKVSVLAPIGTALIGFRKGQTVSWNVPSGKKDFKIVDVNNDNLSE